MSTFEQQVAKNLLRARATGYTLGFWLSVQATRYIFLVSALATILLAYLLEPTEMNTRLAFPILGFGVGALWRDFAFLRASKRVWPINRQLLDWNKVQQLAEGKPLDSTGTPFLPDE